MSKSYTLHTAHRHGIQSNMMGARIASKYKQTNSFASKLNIIHIHSFKKYLSIDLSGVMDLKTEIVMK